MEQPPLVDEDKKAIQEAETEEENRAWYRKIKWMVTLMIVAFLTLSVGVYVFLQHRENVREQASLSVDEAVEYFTPRQTTYQDYRLLFKNYGITKPESAFTYNIQIPKEERDDLDPKWRDVYLGYETNRNLSISLFGLKGGKILLMYDTKTGEVITAVSWKKDIDQKLSLEILQVKGKKAKLTHKAAETTDPKERERLKKDIDNINDQLAGLYDELTKTLH